MKILLDSVGLTVFHVVVFVTFTADPNLKALMLPRWNPFVNSIKHRLMSIKTSPKYLLIWALPCSTSLCMKNVGLKEQPDTFLWVRTWCRGNVTPQNSSGLENSVEKSGHFHTTRRVGAPSPHRRPLLMGI